MDQAKRLDYIDFVKGIGILLVLLGHLLEDDNPIKSVIYSFHMPLFFMVSGILVKNECLKDRIYKRLYSIWIPYIIWGFMFAGFSYKKAAFILYGTNETLLKAGSNGMLWFLLSMLVASVVGGQIISAGKRFKNYHSYTLAAVIVLIAVSWILNLFHDKVQIKGQVIGLPAALDVSILAAAFLVSGKFLADYFFPKLEALQVKTRILLSCILMLVSVVGIYEKNKNGYPQMATYDIGNPVLYFTAAAIVGVGIIALAQYLAGNPGVQNRKIAKCISWLGANSMLVFIVHRTLLYPLKTFCGRYNRVWMYALMWIILLIYSSVLSWIIGYACPFLAGKYRPQIAQNRERMTEREDN